MCDIFNKHLHSPIPFLHTISHYANDYVLYCMLCTKMTAQKKKRRSTPKTFTYDYLLVWSIVVLPIAYEAPLSRCAIHSEYLSKTTSSKNLLTLNWQRKYQMWKRGPGPKPRIFYDNKINNNNEVLNIWTATTTSTAQMTTTTASTMMTMMLATMAIASTILAV